MNARQLVRIAAATIALGAGCQDGGVNITVVTVFTIPQNPVNHVDTFIEQHVLRVGDTTTATSGAYDSLGNETLIGTPAIWQLSDSSVVRLEPAPFSDSRLVRATAPGVTAVTGKFGTVLGSDSVWVFPAGATLQLQLSSTQVAVGDTIVLTSSIANGGSTRAPIVKAFPFSTGSGSVTVSKIDTLGHWRIVGSKAGAVTLKAALG